MRKGVIIGIIVGIVVVVGIASAVVFTDQPSQVSTEIEITATEEISLEAQVSEEPTVTESPGKALSIEFEETIGIKTEP